MRFENYLEKEVDLTYPIKMDGEEYTTIIVRESGGRDEEALGREEEFKKDDVLALIYTITRCIAEVPGAKRLPTMDEVGILPYDVIEKLGVEIRRLTLGDEFKALGVCPHCSKHVEYDIVTDDFLVNTDIKHTDKVIPMRRGIVRNNKSLKNCKLRPFNAFAMVELRKLTEEEFSNTTRNSNLLLTLIESFDDIEPSLDDIKDLTKGDRKLVFEAMDIPKIIKPVLPFACSHCDKDIDLRVWVFDFL